MTTEIVFGLGRALVWPVMVAEGDWAVCFKMLSASDAQRYARYGAGSAHRAESRNAAHE